ncbi:MAG TPA: c-type cytochrome domain-containing protein, partial [Chthoniobacteraceae bacterium]|nr:c-type cytochrome domain-containing protein [Chthoniobacteraceae bacterium]
MSLTFSGICMKIFAACAAGTMLVATTVIAAERPPDFQKQIVPLLENYCYDCHGEGEKKGGLALDKYQSLDAHLRDTELWYPVWKNVDSQLMPPAKETQLAPAERDKLLRWIETAVFKVDPANPDPGRVTIR